MESLTRLVTESLARHGFERPLDYRRLRWSRWFRCESHHSLLQVPSKAGVFALAEEIVDFESNHVGADAFVRPAEPSSAVVEARRFSAASSEGKKAALSAEDRLEQESAPRRMLAVAEFFDADDMAFVLDRMLARPNPVRDRLASGRYFIRFVIIEDAVQRRSVYNALTQWLADRSIGNSAIGNSEIGNSAIGNSPNDSAIASHFASSLELTPTTEYVPAAAQASLFENASVGQTSMGQTSVGRTLMSANMSANPGIAKNPNGADEINQQTPIAARQLNSEATRDIRCSSIFPSGF